MNLVGARLDISKSVQRLTNEIPCFLLQCSVVEAVHTMIVGRGEQ